MKMKGETLWRMFCAVELPAELRARAAERSARLREAFPRARASWERAEKMHLTVKFVGEVSLSRVEELSEAAGRAAGACSPFALTVAGAGAFPPKGQPRVLWLGVEDASGGLANLQRRLEDECARSGFPREPRPFRPHLTLARLRAPQDARELAARHLDTDFEPQTFNVNELLVIRSELGPSGSRYTLITQHRLKN